MEKIAIGYGEIENGRKGYGWLPQIIVNGEPRSDTWLAAGYDRDVAREMARRMATEEAERYVGDWDIQINEILA